MEKTKILVVSFDNQLDARELPMFRGAINSTMENANILFHNHSDDDKLRYSYPLIQYKRIRRNAAIVCIGEGTEAIGQFFGSANFDVRIGDKSEHLSVASVNANQYLVQVWDNMFTYRIRKWLPFNKEHYDKFQQLESLAEKYELLESILTGNILSFGKGIGVTFDKQIVCKITEMLDQQLITYKGVKLMGFDMEFKSNVSLPNYIGLGKGVSLGNGTVVQWERKNKE